MKREKIKTFLLGVITTVIVSGVITVFAATIDVELGGIRIFLDGEEQNLTDVNGDIVEPMIYNGTTYVPVRAISEFFGKKVDWDETEYSVYIGGKPSTVPVAAINGEEITDADVNYNIYAQAMQYAQNNNMTQEDLNSFDWNNTYVDGINLADTIKNKALDIAINDVITVQKGVENGIALTVDEESQIESQVSGIISTYGEDGFILRARTMAIPTPAQYEKMYKRVIATQKIESDISKNPAKYLPEDISILNHYIRSDGATAKHILIEANDTNKAEKRRIAENVLKRIQSGEDFDKLAEEFNDDPGATPEGYTFKTNDMEPAFEKAAFALKIGELSGLVETSYGYHIIKRLPGIFELQGYWKAEQANNINVIDNALYNLDVNAVMADVLAAEKELAAQQY